MVGESASIASSVRTEHIIDFLKQNLTDSMSVSDESAYANNFDQDEEAEHFPGTCRLFHMIPHMIVTYYPGPRCLTFLSHTHIPDSCLYKQPRKWA